MSLRPVISRERFRRVVAESYPGLYLTIVSVIQGVALGTLVLKTSPVFASDGALGAALTALLGILMIAYVWFAYVTAGITYGWEPGWWGSFLPLCIGYLESAAILSLSRPAHAFALYSAMALAGVFEHVDMHLELKRSDTNCPDILDHEIGYQRKQIAVFCGLTALLAGAGVAWWRSPGLGRAAAILLLTAVFALLNWREHVEWKDTLRRLDCDPEGAQEEPSDAAGLEDVPQVEPAISSAYRGRC